MVQSVADGIARQIRTGAYRAGNVLPSEHVLAESFGVSRGTVRRSIELLVASGAITRRPHSRPIISKSTPSAIGNEIYVWVSRPIADEQALVLIREISKGLRGTTYRLVVREPSRFTGAVVRSDERDFLLSVLDNPAVAGAIIERDPFADNDDVFRKLVARGKHLVFVDTPAPDGIHSDYVGTTNATASRTCVEHLLTLGHSRIYFVADCDGPKAAGDRMRGYWRAMRQAGVESLGKTLVATDLPPATTCDMPLAGPYARVIKRDPWFSDLASRVVSRLVATDPRPTALFCCHDVMAYWVCAMLEGQGVSVPLDISVAGFDWLAKWDSNTPDFLTTAGQDFAGFGLHAANLLLDRLSGEAPPEPRHVLLDAPLVVRSSTVSDLLLPAIEPAPSTRAK